MNMRFHLFSGLIYTSSSIKKEKQQKQQQQQQNWHISKVDILAHNAHDTFLSLLRWKL